MAKCPKCGRKLHLYDVSQFCPGCGVNMRFYGFEENFYREAKLAELSQAGVHIKVRRLKAAFIGSKLCIARLVVMLLPIAALLVPNGGITVNMPFKTLEYAFGALGIYGMFTDGGFNYINTMTASGIYGDAFTSLRNALFVYASVALVGVIVLLLSILCFISYKNMQKIICVFAAIGIADSIAAMFVVNSLAGSFENVAMLNASKGFGLLLAAAMFAAVFVVNLLLCIKGIPVEYDEGMVERNEIYRQVKAGKVSLDDLPQPVVETEETRKIDAEIAKEEEAHRLKKEKNAEVKENG